MSIFRKTLVSLISGFGLGALIAACSPGNFLAGWLGAGLLAAVVIFALLSCWAWAGGGRLLATLVAVAFLLRLVIGMLISLGLPVFGYPEPEQQAGYVFYDAYRRDNQAWELASSGQPILQAFGREFATDQYGGLLALSAGIYRLLSPDAHRPFLILLLAAFGFAVGVPFFYRGVMMRWGAKVAALAGWIFVLYPDGILFSASQMREPFLIGLASVAFWGVIAWSQVKRQASLAAILGGLALMALFSSRVVLMVAAVLVAWFFFDHLYDRIPARRRLPLWIGLAVLAGLVLFLSWGWFASAMAWDLSIITNLSGQGEKAVQAIGEAFRPVFYTLYGLTRPLLPAAIATVRPPWIWKTIDIFRSTGWYALAPLLLYSFWSLWKSRDPRERRILAWFALAVIAWLLISSARAGGDTWDNPRYRTIFLPWMALLSGWGLAWAVEHRDAWLPRWIAVEVIFLAFLSQWYLSRYWTWLAWRRMPFWNYIVWVGMLSALVLVGGWVYDRLRPRSSSEQTTRRPVL
ncbi:MAG TPA: hypothetical protein VHO48_07460 [Anaerolineaceae bacterium]|nr:hypothetical protein [Anaerolineaceae bacterium]